MSSQTASPFPHTFQPVTVRSIYIKLTAALAPLLFFGMWRGGVPVVMTFLVALATGAVAEFLVDLFRTGAVTSSPVKNGRVLYLMALLAVLVPANTSPIVVAIAAAAAVLIGVYLMGDTGVYYVHPVFIGLLVVAGGGVTTVPIGEPDALAPLTQIVADSVVYQNLTDSVFAPLGMRVPPEALALFINVGDVGAVSIGAALFPPLFLGALIIFGEDLVPPTVVVTFLLGVVSVLFFTDADIIDVLVRSKRTSRPCVCPRRPGGSTDACCEYGHFRRCFRCAIGGFAGDCGCSSAGYHRRWYWLQRCDRCLTRC